MGKSSPAAILLLALLPGCISVPQTLARVTPQRPTLSADTSTTAPGTFEIEAGLAHDDEGNLDTPVVLKHGLDARSEVFVGVSPLRIADRPGKDGKGMGDLLLGVRHRLRSEETRFPDAAVQVAAKLPLADEDEGLGTGETDVFVAGMAGYQRQGWSLGAFYQLGLLGEVGDGGLDVGHDLAASGFRPIDGKLALFGEVAGQFVTERDYESVYTTWGFAYAFHPALVMDVGVAVGISADAPDAVVLIGFTRNFGRVLLSPRW